MRYLFALVFAGLMAFFGAEHGSLAMSSPSMPHSGQKTAEIANHCQLACPLRRQEDNQTIVNREEDDEPEPFPFAAILSPAYLNYLYFLALKVLTLAFLRRRPPDLLAAYSLFRT